MDFIVVDGKHAECHETDWSFYCSYLLVARFYLRSGMTGGEGYSVWHARQLYVKPLI